MKLPQIKRLLIDDFVSEKKWITPLFLTLNTFMESIVGGLNKALTVNDNMSGSIQTITLNSVPSQSSPYSFAWKQVAPKVVLVGNVTSDSGLVLTSAIQVQFAYSNGQISITNVVGCTPTNTNQHYLTLLILCN